ncbi:unnamed protein product, partial [Meganyctiphanes norvegica]
RWASHTREPTIDTIRLLYHISRTPTMNIALILLVATFAHGRPTEIINSSGENLVDVTRYEVLFPDEDGSHSVDFEADNGISFQLSGTQSEDGGSNMVGSYIYIVDGEVVPLTFVADESGFQPSSSLLPVAPAFPHEIPDWVIKQIEFAEQQKAEQQQYKES